MFTDKIDIEIRAGKGGDGMLSFRHEKFKAKGGPDGGNGGRGGNVIFEVDHNLNTLSYFRNHKRVEAENGQPGGRDRRHGKKGESTVVKVPPGTVVLEGGQKLVDLTGQEESAVIAKGGKGGYGNAHFVSSVRQAPRIAELGEPGEEKQLTLELKLVADVGLVGMPNAGKSTLLSVISNARPEIADYPFTTLVPNLGVVDFDGFSFVAADIPGLIEGASHGKGLGDEFLRHIERTAVIWHLVDAGADDPVRAYQTIMGELKEYSAGLLDKPQLVALTKTDTLTKEELDSKLAKFKKTTKGKVYLVSSVAHQGLNELIGASIPLIKNERSRPEPETKAAVPVIDTSSLPDYWEVDQDQRGFIVRGQQIEGFARRTNFDQPDARRRFMDILNRQGISRELMRKGIKEGDTVKIADKELEW